MQKTYIIDLWGLWYNYILYLFSKGGLICIM